MPNLIEIVLHATDDATVSINRVRESMLGMGDTAQGLTAALMGPAGIAAAAVLAGGAMAELSVKFSAGVVELQNMSNRSNIGLNSLRDLQTVLREAHIPTEMLNTALAMLNRNLEEHKKSLVAIVGDTMDPMTALLKLAQAVADGGNAADIAFRAMGRGGVMFAGALKEMGASLKDVEQRLPDLSPAVVLAAKEFDKNVEETKTMFKSGWDQMIGDATVTLETLWESLKQGKDIAKATGDAIREMVAQAMHVSDRPSFARGATDVPNRPSNYQTPNPLGGAADDIAAWEAYFKLQGFTDTIAVDRRGTTPQVGDYNKMVRVLGWMNPVDLEAIRKKLKETNSEAKDLLNTASSNLTSGFADAFAQIITGGQGAASAVANAFIGAAQDIARKFAEMGLEFLLNLFTSGIGGDVLGVALGPISSQTFGGPTPHLPPMPNMMGGVTINTLDAQTLRQQLTNPNSALSRAFRASVSGQTI